MVLFAILMIAASLSMINGKSEETNKITAEKSKINLPKLLSYGVVIGLATGVLGAGGGFL